MATESTWTTTPPRQTGYYGFELGSIPMIAWCVWSEYNETLSVYVPGRDHELGQSEQKHITLWTTEPIKFPPLPEDPTENPV